MGDTVEPASGIGALFGTATEQMGYVTTAQAVESGVSRRALSHHAQSGTLRRVRHGLYRLRDYPSSPHEDIMAAWLAVGKAAAFVSHESALDLLDLSDVIPDAVHITVPRGKRHLPTLPGVIIHTTTRPPGPYDVMTREGMVITSATRTVLDAARYGTGPEQIEMAIRQGVERGLIIPERLIEQARSYGNRVRDIVDGAIAGTELDG